ncbi:hypothetical protein ILYODFUR_001526 [Ilyodon furcidens]|uniref:Uncharacterized protein n=1 Tax=Ilyodon furcidens TaxID=33524 RepID=A0ABV0TTZ1_9TELE
MSKGNLPQTEAGSSEAVAPGKAELLSFLKCQRGTGTGNTFSAKRCDFLPNNKPKLNLFTLFISSALRLSQHAGMN